MKPITSTNKIPAHSHTYTATPSVPPYIHSKTMPGPAPIGSAWYDPQSLQSYIYDGTNWVAMALGVSAGIIPALQGYDWEWITSDTFADLPNTKGISIINADWYDKHMPDILKWVAGLPNENWSIESKDIYLHNEADQTYFQLRWLNK